MNKFIITIKEGATQYGDNWEEAFSPKNALLFSARDLSHTPEDAILGRDLFSAYDYIKAVEFGMALQKQGYDTLDIIYTQSNEE